MELELLMRGEPAMSEEEQSEYNTAKLLSDFDEDSYERSHPKQYVYFPCTIDIRDAMPFNYVDEEHTRLYLAQGLSFVAKVPYEMFKSIRQAMLGNVVKTADDFKFVKQRPR